MLELGAKMKFDIRIIIQKKTPSMSVVFIVVL